MSTETETLIDEIMDMVNGERDKGTSTITPEPEPEPELDPLPALEETDWEEIEPGIERGVFKYTTLFGKIHHYPDHLITCYKGYDKVPEKMATYVPPTKEFELFSLMLSIGNKTNLVGPTGCGKTLMTEHYAAHTGRPYVRISCDKALIREREIGQIHINVDADGKQTTDFRMGRVPTAMLQPSLFCLDEVTRANGFANVMWQSILDRMELALPELKDSPNAVIKAHKDFTICASDNTKGNGDDMDKYIASNVQDASFINRWDVVIETDYLSEADEVKLIENLSGRLTPTEVKMLARLSALFHRGFKSGELSVAFSPRNLEAITKMTRAGVSLQHAVELNYTSRVPQSEVSDIQENIRAVFGD